MMTNAPSRGNTSDHKSDAVRESPRGIVASALARVQQGLCALHGHDSLRQYEKDRIYLRCTSCGYESPGWEVARRAAPARLRAEAAHGAGDLVVARRVA